MNVKERIYQLAKERKISIPALEKKAGLGKSTISKWENSSPTIDKLNSVAEALDVSVDYLLGKATQDASNDDRFEGMDVDEMLDFLANSPNGRVLMSIAKNATTEDLAQIVRTFFEIFLSFFKKK